MKTKVTIMGIHRKYVGDQLVDDLKEIYKDDKPNHYFSAPHLLEDDPVVKKILDRLSEAGMNPRISKSGKGEIDYEKEYIFRRFHVYEPSDFEGLDYLALNPHEATPAGYRTDGLIELMRAGLNKTADLMVMGAGWYVVPDRIKAVIESSDLVGPMFRPTRLIDDPGPRKKYFDWQEEFGSTWWELTSEIAMPPLSDTVEVRDRNSQPLKDRQDFSNGFYPVDGFYARPELHYRRSEMDAMPAFDLAKTYEPMGINEESDARPLIASRRFYDFCREKQIKTEWVPIRIEEDR